MQSQAIAMSIDPKRLVSLNDLPQEQGLYALADHHGNIRYVGITTMSIHRRVYQYHVAGDGNSHKYSSAYNNGLLWHDRKNPLSDTKDGAVAKRVRRDFARKHCKAIGFPLPYLSKAELEQIEREVIALVAGLEWNGKKAIEPVDPGALLEKELSQLSHQDFSALMRQRTRWLKLTGKPCA